MSLPLWAINESKRRKKNPNYSELPVYEITIKYLSGNGQPLYKSKSTGSHGRLSQQAFAALAAEIEDEQQISLKKYLDDEWYESPTHDEIAYEPVYDQAGNMIGHLAPKTFLKRLDWVKCF
jgi:hydroxymethylpyrimidine pyrophosphatase-like HAD family hydrolase